MAAGRDLLRRGRRSLETPSGRVAEVVVRRQVVAAARSPDRATNPRIALVIDREQVLHVARLARLRLDDAEVETMAGELSGILGHVDRISDLDLEGVEPTSHVVELENVLRADRPWTSLPPSVALALRARALRGRLPRPLAAGRRRLMADLLDLTVAEAAAKIAAGEVSADEYGAAWKAAAATDELNAYLWKVGDGATAGDWTGAGESAPPGEGVETPYGSNAPEPADSGPLAGVPIAIKDIFTTEGIPTTAGSKILAGYRPPYTATAVRRLTAAGARVLGKTNMDEFAMGSSNENSAYGPVLNPWDRGRVPGGSSGGSAAVVAGGLAPAALGTDTGGSIRQPASLCGIVGLKPTYGAVSRFGMIAFASSLDQCGPLTRDVTDAALLLGVLQGKDPLDSTSVGLDGAQLALPSREDLAGLRFGVPKEIGEAALDAGVRAVFEATIARIEELGGEIAEVALPHAEHGISAYYVIAPAEASSNLARYDGVRYGVRAGGDADLIEMYERTRSEGFGAEVKRRIMLGTYALSSGYYDAYYGQAQKVRTRIAAGLRHRFRGGRLRRHPDLAVGRLRAGGEDGRSAGDVPQRLLHGADEPRRDPGDLDPGRAGRAGGRRRRRAGAAGRLPDRRPRLRRGEAAGGRARARGRARLRRRGGRRRSLEGRRPWLSWRR